MLFRSASNSSFSTSWWFVKEVLARMGCLSWKFTKALILVNHFHTPKISRFPLANIPEKITNRLLSDHVCASLSYPRASQFIPDLDLILLSSGEAIGHEWSRRKVTEEVVHVVTTGRACQMQALCIWALGLVRFLLLSRPIHVH